MGFSSFSSSSLVMYAILVWYSVAISPILCTDDYQYTTEHCKKAKDPGFCLEAMSSDPRTKTATSLDHEQIAIDLAAAQTGITRRQIQIFSGQTSDPRLKEIYGRCGLCYDAAVEAMTEAKRSAYQLKHFYVIRVSQIAYNDAIDCEKTFQQPPPRNSTLSEQTRLMDLLTNIVQVFASALILPPK